jgi:predicted GNAT family N-acyltransferase
VVEDMNVELIKHGTPEYDDLVELRREILRRPLGLVFTPEQLAQEKNEIHVGAYENGALVGCCVLTPVDNNTIQLRQMAVAQNVQTKGIGKKIIAFAEKISKEKGYTLLMMHARKVAIGFYEKCGYEIRGDEFTEVTIPHYYMEKRLG